MWKINYFNSKLEALHFMKKNRNFKNYIVMSSLFQIYPEINKHIDF